MVVQTLKVLGDDLEARYELVKFFLSHDFNVWAWDINRKLDFFSTSDRKMIDMENFLKGEVTKNAEK